MRSVVLSEYIKLTAGNSYTAGDSDVIATLTLDSGIATALTDEDCNIDSFTVFIQHSDGSTQDIIPSAYEL